ncbi:MAG TPA: PAS domain-containing protein, partial [Opitutaceae bacterium]|nr:PAS domain-containing protein [Opitutaceae bacterium]
MSAQPVTTPKEAARLEALRRYHILDTPPEEAFDDLVKLAAQLCRTPIALISLVDERRQWFKARVGLTVNETPRDQSFCAHSLDGNGELLIIPDTQADARFQNNPLVLGTPDIRFYAGAPIITTDGHILGSICVIDRTPREISDTEKSALTLLAREVCSQMELRRIATELREGEERYRMMFERNPMPMWIFNHASLQIVAVNESAVALYGYSTEEFLAMTVKDIRPPEDISTFEKIIAPAMGPFRAASRWRHRRKDGTIFPVDIYSHSILFDGKPARLVLSVDMSNQQNAIEALQASEERFKLVARTVSDVIWDWNLNTNQLWWSEGFSTVFGYDLTLIEPGIESWTNRLHPDDRERVLNGIHAVIDSGGSHWSDEYRFRRKSGEYAFVQDRGHVMRDVEGKAIRMLGGVTDLTERKRLEAQYLRAQRMESIGTLAGGIAHDLNNVLSPVLMSIELLKMSVNNDADALQLLETIEASTKRGADLVKQVLVFARGADGRHSTVDLRSLLADIEDIARKTFPRSIRLLTEMQDGLWPVLGDITQLHQVLLNLAVNARDAMPVGGTLTFSAQNLVIDQQYAGTSREALPGSYVMLSVSDTGQGIAPEIRERIFEPFFTTKGVGEGTGLGLSTVHAIVKGHGGFVSVYSEIGQGSTFKVYIPADPHLSLNVQARFTPELPLGRGEWVLVVDD